MSIEGTIIRPTMTMVQDLMCRVINKETWILNDCAIIEHKDGKFAALLAKRMDDGDIYYGIIPDLHPNNDRRDTRGKLDKACENFESLPRDAFREAVTWERVEQGNRYS